MPQQKSVGRRENTWAITTARLVPREADRENTIQSGTDRQVVECRSEYSRETAEAVIPMCGTVETYGVVDGDGDHRRNDTATYLGWLPLLFSLNTSR